MKVKYVGPKHQIFDNGDMAEILSIRDAGDKFTYRIRLDKDNKIYKDSPVDYFEINLFENEFVKVNDMINYVVADLDATDKPDRLNFDLLPDPTLTTTATGQLAKKPKIAKKKHPKLVVKQATVILGYDARPARAGETREPWIYLKNMDDSIMSYEHPRYIFKKNANNMFKFLVDNVGEFNTIHLQDGGLIVETNNGGYGGPAPIRLKPDETKKFLKNMLKQYAYLLDTKDELDDTYILI